MDILILHVLLLNTHGCLEKYFQALNTFSLIAILALPQGLNPRPGSYVHNCSKRCHRHHNYVVRCYSAGYPWFQQKCMAPRRCGGLNFITNAPFHNWCYQPYVVKITEIVNGYVQKLLHDNRQKRNKIFNQLAEKKNKIKKPMKWYRGEVVAQMPLVKIF